MFLLGFICSLPQLAWEKGFDVVVVELMDSWQYVCSLFCRAFSFLMFIHDTCVSQYRFFFVYFINT
jgi:hypothetical protein